MIKASSILLFISLYCSLCYSQSIDSILNEGNELQKSGCFKDAIAKYKEALLIDSKSPNINYQIAYTYLLQKEYHNSIKYCNKLINSNSQNAIEAFILKGSSLDYLGKHKKAITLYRKAIKIYPNSYLLHFNLGISLHNSNKINEAEIEYLKAIQLNKFHPGSHLMFGILMSDRGYRIRSMLSLYFFLLLEPDTERSTEAYQLLENLWLSNIEINPSDSSSIKISLSSVCDKPTFNELDLSISQIAAKNLLEKTIKFNRHEQFISSTTSFFSLLSSIVALGNDDIWSSFYAPFFYDLYKENLTEPFCYYISTTFDDEFINGWLESNRFKIEVFSNWANERLKKE